MTPVEMSLDTKTKLLGLVCAAMDHRETRPYILEMDGLECLAAGSMLRHLDRLLKAQWQLMGAPDWDEEEDG
jgi:hypothetical protein